MVQEAYDYLQRGYLFANMDSHFEHNRGFLDEGEFFIYKVKLRSLFGEKRYFGFKFSTGSLTDRFGSFNMSP